MIRYNEWPIGRQISVAAIALVVFGYMAVAILLSEINRAHISEEIEDELKKDTRLMTQVLDAYFSNVKDRGERESNTLRQFLGGDVSLAGGRMPTGDKELPTLRVGGETINGNHKLLERFKSLTGSDVAFLVVDEGKLFRAATLLKKDGKHLDGSPLPDTDPVPKAILAGNDYSGMTIRNGEYFLSVVKVLKGSDGKAFGAMSVRVSLAAELKQIRDIFSEMKAGETGYVYIMRPTGDPQTIAEFVAHPKYQGKTINETDLEETTRKSLQAMIDKGPGIHRYELLNAQGRMAERIVYVAQSDSWKWLVVFGTWTEEYMDAVRETRNLVFGVGMVAAALTAVLLGLLIRMRLAALSPAIDAIRRLGEGDLTARLATGANGTRNEVGLLADALNGAIDRIRSLVAGVEQSGRSLVENARTVEEQASGVAAGANQQSNAASAMAASVEQLSVSISHVADSAQSSAGASRNACEATLQGRGVVESTATEMRSIANEITRSADGVEALVQHSQQISSVVQVIREIADQTNLLALNAAIEAARAGEQGRGFAVVADEVRKLAERTSASTQEIGDTISAMVDGTNSAVKQMQSVRQRVNEGVRLAEETTTALSQIEQRAQESLDIAHDIANGTREQSATSQELARSVEQIAQSSETAAQSASQNQRAAHELRDLAGQLQQEIGRFRL